MIYLSNTRFCLFIAALLLLLSYPTFSCATIAEMASGQPAPPGDTTEDSGVSLYSWVHFDLSGKKTFIEVQNLNNTSWLALPENNSNYNFFDSEYWQAAQGAVLWVYLKSAEVETKRKVWLEILPNTGVDGQLAASVNDNWQWQSAVDRINDEKHRRPARFLTFEVFSEQLHDGVYLRLRTDQAPQFSLRAQWSDQLFWNQATNYLFFGLVSGMLVVAMIYNFAVGLSARESVYLYYSLYVTSNLIYCMVIGGYTRILFPEWGNSDVMSNVTVTLLILSVMMFIRKLLNLDVIAPRFDRLLHYTGYIGLAMIPCYFMLSSFVAYTLAITLGMVVPIMLLFCGITAWRQNHPLAIYYLIAWTVYLTCSSFWGWMWLGVIEGREWTIWVYYFGTLVEALLLSIVLGFRFNYFKVRTERAQKAQQIAEETAQLKSQFLATMSHELRTPLNGVIGLTDLLQSTRLDEHQLNYVETIKHSGSALVRIINDILDYSKMEAGKLEIEDVVFSVRQLIDETLLVLSPLLNNPDVKLVCIIDKDVPDQVISDPTRIRQVLTNLIGNAIKFTEKGYVLLELKFMPESQRLHYVVKDTGIGISLERQQHLFKSYSQAEKSTARKYGGTGLGLTISQSLVSMMGGQIELKSEPGTGSEFSFYTPIELTGTAKQDKQRGLMRDLVVLVIDPFEVQMKAAAHWLSYWEAKVTCWTEVKQSAFESMPKIDFVLMSGLLNETDQQLVRHNLNCPVFTLAGSKDLTVDDKTIIDYPLRGTKLLRTIASQIPLKEKQDTNKTTTLQTDRQTGELSRYGDKFGVLVAEDNKVNQIVISGYLAQLGIEPTFAVNGLEAVELCKNNPNRFHLILMDCEMPIMSGYEATQQIRLQEQNANLPIKMIVGLSAHAIAEFQQKAIECGMDKFLTKPIESQKLKSTIQEAYTLLVSDQQSKQVS